MLSDIRWIQDIADELERTGRLGRLREYDQHGSVSVYAHSLAVARKALELADRHHIQVDRRSLVRGALLHDYFLYDWHVKDPDRPLHGFAHPRIALENARRDYDLNPIEEDIIRRHMFPLTPVPPATREGWLVCLADTMCAARETFDLRRFSRSPKRDDSKGVSGHVR